MATPAGPSSFLMDSGALPLPAPSEAPEGDFPDEGDPDDHVVDPVLKEDLGVALQEFQAAKSTDAKVDALVAFIRLARGLI